MNIGSKIAILCITENGKKLACKIKASIEDGDIYFVKNNQNIVSDRFNTFETLGKTDELNTEINLVNDRLKNFIETIFNKYEYLVFIMATGIVIRTIAPLVESKFSDPAILVTDEKGINVISLLSGHMGGANEMTYYISQKINANPVITTATDVNKKSSLDMIAKKLDGYIEDFRENVKVVNSMLVNNKKVGIYIDGDYDIDTRGFIKLDNSKSITELYKEDKETFDALKKIVVITNKSKFIEGKDSTTIELINNQDIVCNKIDESKFIKLVPRDIVIGIGCKKDLNSYLLYESLIDFLFKNNIDTESIKELGSIDIKKDEKAIVDLSKTLQVPFKIIDRNEISKIDHLFEKSEWVKKSVGVYSVAEPVAHILSNGNLIIRKKKYKGIIFSVGRLKI